MEMSSFRLTMVQILRDKKFLNVLINSNIPILLIQKYTYLKGVIIIWLWR